MRRVLTILIVSTLGGALSVATPPALPTVANSGNRPGPKP
jgi:hypothetical protein